MCRAVCFFAKLLRCSCSARRGRGSTKAYHGRTSDGRPSAQEDTTATSPNASNTMNRKASPHCRTCKALLTPHASTPPVARAGDFAVDEHGEVVPIHNSGFSADFGVGGSRLSSVFPNFAGGAEFSNLAGDAYQRPLSLPATVSRQGATLCHFRHQRRVWQGLRRRQQGVGC